MPVGMDDNDYSDGEFDPQQSQSDLEEEESAEEEYANVSPSPPVSSEAEESYHSSDSWEEQIRYWEALDELDELIAEKKKAKIQSGKLKLAQFVDSQAEESSTSENDEDSSTSEPDVKEKKKITQEIRETREQKQQQAKQKTV